MKPELRETGSRAGRRGVFWGIATGLAVGAAAMFTLDPQNGKRRRALARDKAIKVQNTLDRKVSHDIPQRLSYFAGFFEGAKHEIGETIEGADKRPENEQMLVDRVMSSVFRDPDVPKGAVNVDANGTTVFLRGSVDGDDVARDIEERVRAVEGVDDVVNLINQPEADPSEIRPH